jgi:phosphohistidine phosphatase SixA
LAIAPDLILTSRCTYAQETAEGLARCFKTGTPPVLSVETLAPDIKEHLFSFESIVSAALAGGHDLKEIDTAIIVGHEPRLTQLITMMTRQRVPPFDGIEAVCIQANTLNDLRVGRGKVHWRWRFPYPVASERRDELGPKLTGKMTVAGLLAGFNFAALWSY